MKTLLAIVSLLVLTCGAAWGGTWELQTTFNGDVMLGVEFINSKVGWVAGGSNIYGGPCVYQTLNGGNSWNIQTYEMFTFFYLDIDMADSEVGYAGGLAAFMIMGPGAQTKNGGQTWEMLSLLPGLAQAWQDTYTLDRNHVWLTGLWTQLFREHYGVARSTNGGTTWNKLDWGIADAWARYSYFIDANEGWITGGVFPVEEEMRSFYHRFEKDPFAQPLPPGFPGIYDNDYRQDYRGVIAHTTNGGESWELQFDTHQIYMNELWFFDELEGWAVGEAWPNDQPVGVILHTTDGGNSWEQNFMTTQHGLTGIDFVSREQGFATGMAAGIFNPKTRVLQTTNGGETWALEPVDEPYGPMYGSWPVASDGWLIGCNNLNISGVCHYSGPPTIPDMDVVVSNYPSSAQPGETIDWYVTVRNNTPDPVEIDVWLSVTGDPLPPPFNPYLELIAGDLRIPGNFEGGSAVAVGIPGNAPTGTYTVNTAVGSYPDTEYAFDGFDLVIF